MDEAKEEANICLMANTSLDEEQEDDEVMDSDSFNLQDVFYELKIHTFYLLNTIS